MSTSVIVMSHVLKFDGFGRGLKIGNRREWGDWKILKKFYCVSVLDF
jgi:hypothetical protein